MNNPNYDSGTALSDEYWKLFNNKLNPKVEWSILMKTRPPDHVKDRCLLCTNERLRILRFRKRDKLLNKRDELLSACVHKRGLLLKNIIPQNTNT